MGQGVRTGLGHGGITCVLQTQFSSFFFFFFFHYLERIGAECKGGGAFVIGFSLFLKSTKLFSFEN